MIDQQMLLNMIAVSWSIFLFLLLSIGWYYLIFLFISFRKIKPVPHSDKKATFAVLIPARNESQVIEGILSSLEKQQYDHKYFDVWVIVEKEDDPTIEIVLNHNMKYFVRDELNDFRRTKGFALQECIRYFTNNNINYDAYMIFDADNIVADNYLSSMNDLYQSGVQVGSGYRNFTNANKNWIAAGSVILFSYLNQIASRGRSFLFKKCNLFGTGYYVSSEVIRDAGGWRFTGMTEDVQLTSYCYTHDVNMKYYPHCEFYDEQATKFREMHHQHVRWVWGFFAKRDDVLKGGKKYNTLTKKRFRVAMFEYKTSIVPFLVYVIGILILVIMTLGFAIASIFTAPKFMMYLFWEFFGLFMALYTTFVFIAAIVIVRDNHHLKFSKGRAIVACLTYFLTFGDFLFAFFDGLFHKRKRNLWKVIKHDGDITRDNISNKK